MDGAAGREQAQPAGPLARLLPRLGGPEVLDRLVSLSGSDFTSVMLEVARRRAARETPASVLRRYRADRFARPGGVPWRPLRRAEDLLLACLPADVEVLTLAPLVPLGTHSAVAGVSQDWVVTALRACEVAADATNALALEAAARRASSRDQEVRLAAVQRVVRTQPAMGPLTFAHFTLFGLVTAGRAGAGFGRSALAGQLGFAGSALAAAGLREIRVAVTPLSAEGSRLAAWLRSELAAAPFGIAEDHERQSGREYYRDLCFKVYALAGDGPAEFGDGGFTDWTRRLVPSGKEQLLISGLGVDRLALALPPGS